MQEQAPKAKSTLLLQLACVVLVLIVAVMAAIWRPWSNLSKHDEKITVDGETTLKAEPDVYTFSPYYEKNSVDEIKKLSIQLITKLKELGVADKDIKSQISSYDTYPMTNTQTVKNQVTLQLTVTLSDKSLAQKVQDYIATSSPKGAISPNISFSEAKKKELTDKASTAALENAKAKAIKQAGVLGRKLGKVIEIKEGSNSAYPVVMYDKAAGSTAADSNVSLPIQPGESDFPYTVTVIFELK